METKRNVVIFFDDLKEDAQERIIATEMWDIIKTDREPGIRSIRIDPNVYGYDPDPAKQTLENHIYASVVNANRHSEPWILIWDCEKAEFTTVMKCEVQAPPIMEGKLGKALADKSVVVYAPKDNNKTKGE